jgi:3-oxoadipate enol-lactonase
VTVPEIDANGTRLYFEVHGPEEGDVLVLSNGILMSTASWAFQVPVLAATHRVVLYDCRGMWQSAHPPGPYSMDEHADDLAALLDGLGVERAHIGGISYGGEVSMAFALRHPERTRSLVIASSVSEIDPMVRAVATTWQEAVERRDPGLLLQTTLPWNFSARWLAANPEAVRQAGERYRELDLPALGRLIDAFLALDLTARLPEIEAPALVIAGEDDVLKPRRFSEVIAAGIPDSHLAIVPNAGHAVMWEQSVVFNALVAGFLAQV